MAIALTLSSWQLQISQSTALQFDNLTVPLTVSGDIPAGFFWQVLVACGDQLNVITLAEINGVLSTALTAEDLAIAGIYTLQLRASAGELVKHSTKIVLNVPDSLSGDEHWPTVPTAFTQALEAAQDAAEAAGNSAAEAQAWAEASAAGGLIFHIDEDGHLIVEREDPNNE